MDDLTPEEQSLTSALRAVAADDQRLSASAAVEARVLAEVRSLARRRRVRARAAMLAAAAALFIAIALPLWPTAGDVGRPLTDRRAVVADGEPVATGFDAGAAEMVTEFFPLTYSTVPASGGQVVRMQVPRAALARFGVSSFEAADDRSSTVLAEVVVGNDGLARAVRFVRAAGVNEQEEQKQ